MSRTAILPGNISTKLCFEGLEERYGVKGGEHEGEVDQELKDRLTYELSIIHDMGYVDYFLIVWDFIKYARDHKIMVGPGAWIGSRKYRFLLPWNYQYRSY